MTTDTLPAEPEQQFWQRYSPHAEFPLAGLASLAWHVFWPVLLVFCGFAIAWNRPDEMQIDSAIVTDTGAVGGGGNSTGEGGSGGMTEAASPEELPNDLPPPTLVQANALPSVKAPTNLPETDDVADPTRAFEKGKDALARLGKARADAAAGSGDSPGGGTGNGNGSGNGPGNGSGVGPGTGTSNVRSKRQVRWTILLNTPSGDGYRQTLASLGAILVMKNPQDGVESMYRQLYTVPSIAEPADPQIVRTRIFFVDDDPRSIRDLTASMRIGFTPESVRVCYTTKFEEELASKERAFRNKREEEIYSTKFQIVSDASTGGYKVFVVEQKLNGQP